MINGCLKRRIMHAFYKLLTLCISKNVDSYPKGVTIKYPGIFRFIS